MTLGNIATTTGHRLRALVNNVGRISFVAHQGNRKSTQQSFLNEPTIREKQAELADFYLNYEELVELICDAANYGPNEKMDLRFDELRDYMQKNYHPMRNSVAAYLELDPQDNVNGLDLYGKPSDAFEALFSAPTLREQIRTDDGHLISRIMRTRKALNRYADYLRTQVKAS